jgi:cytochrome c
MRTLLLTVAFTATLAQALATPLYNSCKGCHGLQGERKAMGKSLIIGDMNSTQVSAALHGYKDGSYGKAMKGLMKGQVARLSDENIKELAEYISTLEGSK